MKQIIDILPQIAESVAHYRKRSERVVGFVHYNLPVEIHEYEGTTAHPEKIDILCRTLVRLIGAGVTTCKSLASYVGIDLEDSLEKFWFDDAIKWLSNTLEFVNDTGKALSLTQRGETYIKEGTCENEFSREFQIYVTPLFPAFANIHYATSNASLPFKSQAAPTVKLSIKEIQDICEVQASHMHSAKEGRYLTTADLISSSSADKELYICLLQSIRDNSMRAIAYDFKSAQIIPELSPLFEKKEIIDSLLEQCLREDDFVKVNSGEKPTAQIALEEQILKEDQLDPSQEKANDEKGVGSQYETKEFENELRTIFEDDKNQEVWLISPWIKDNAFIRARVPMIKKCLSKGGKVFIGYSESENLGEEMVQSDSMNVLHQLDANYDNFFFAQLPKFHSKTVIAYKDNRPILYSGSFNVLSFVVRGNDEHYRKEYMIRTNETEAKKERDYLIQQFAEKYISILQEDIDKCSEDSEVYAGKVMRLQDITKDNEAYKQLIEAANNKHLIISKSREIQEEALKAFANKMIQKASYKSKEIIQGQLLSLLYLFDSANKEGDKKEIGDIEKAIFRYLEDGSFYTYCRISCRKNHEDEQKNSSVTIVFDGYYYYFKALSLPKTTFLIVSKHKEYINVKEENLQNARWTMNELLRYSYRSLAISGNKNSSSKEVLRKKRQRIRHQ